MNDTLVETKKKYENLGLLEKASFETKLQE